MRCSFVRAWSNSRICACTVTSRAVVGSSAMRRLGFGSNGHGDDRPLPHPAAELMGVIGEPIGRIGHTDPFEQLGSLSFRLLALVSDKDLGDLLANSQYRVEGAERVLVDNAHLVPPYLPQLLLGELHQVSTLQLNAAANSGSPGGEGAQGRANLRSCPSHSRRLVRRARPPLSRMRFH